ncbi:hypothetical protein pb186bvf_008001 [Paramecium bursaria]
MDTVTPQSNLCKVIGHVEQQLIPYMCTSQRCDQVSRFMCQECLVDFLHSHNGQKPQLLSKEKLSAQFKSNIVELKQRHQKKLQASVQQNIETFQIISDIEVYLKNLKQGLEQQKEQSSDSDENYFESLNTLITESFFQLSSDNISKILNVSDYKLNIQIDEELKQNFQELNLLFGALNDRITRYHVQNALDKNSINIDDKIKQFKYTDEFLQSYSNKRDYSHIQISPNNLYVAVAYKEEIQQIDYKRIKKNNYEEAVTTSYEYGFEIMDFDGKHWDKIKLANNQIDFLQFSNDSQILYYYENSEPFSSYNIFDGKKIQYKYFLELRKIKFILPVPWNRAFVINQFDKIQLLDMEFENKLFEIQTLHLNDIIYDNVHKILISSGYTSISLFDGETGQMINENNLKLNLKQLQLSEDGTILYGNDKEYFYKLQIVHNQKLIEISVVEKVKHQEAIISYRLVWNLQYIIFFGENGIVSIQNQNLKMIKQFFLGLHGEQRMLLTSGSCSDDFSEITVASK